MIEKILKLWELANRPGTDAEGMNAMTKAYELMQKHGISLDEVMAARTATATTATQAEPVEEDQDDDGDKKYDDLADEFDEEKEIGPYVLNRMGVWFLREKRDGSIERVQVTKTPLDIEAESRNEYGKDWGKLLCFLDPTGNKRTFHLNMATLGNADIKRLLHEGLRLGSESSSRSLLFRYLHELRSGNLVLSSTQPGWCDGNFVLPFTSVGPEPVFYSSQQKHHTFRQKGTLKEWRDNVAKLCIGNDRLSFGASCGFAAPLLRPLNIEGGGFHICGKKNAEDTRSTSSQGKSTMLQMAASIYGSGEEGSRDRYFITWDTTKGALEQTAEAHNDCLITCDELGLSDATKLGDTLYMMANGVGKGRMGEQKRTWRILMLTSGEVSIAEHMAAAGKQVMMGQEARLLQVYGDAEQGLGLFQDIKSHGFDDPADFANHIKKVVGKYYGTPLLSWLKVLIGSKDEIVREAQEIMDQFQAAALPGTHGGIAPRAARRFAVVAAAGELATKHGLTGWKHGQAFNAAMACFLSWKAHYRTIDPTMKAIDRVRDFIADHAQEFHPATAKIESTIGYTKKGYFMILPDVFRDIVCQGVDYQEVASQLQKVGYLETSPKRQLKAERINGQVVRVYNVSEAILREGG